MISLQTIDLEKLDVFFGAATDTLARIYARMPRPAERALILRGKVTGPQSAYAHTLPASFPLRDMGPGLSLLAEALVPEPCFWTPDLPNLYRVEVELCKGDQTLASTSRTFGIRRLGTSGRNLIFDGKRSVLRAVTFDDVPPAPLLEWRDASAAAIVNNPSDDLCGEASRVGVLIVADLRSTSLDIADELRRLARFPAVGIAILPTQAASSDPHGLAPNILLAQYASAGEKPSPTMWAKLLVREAKDPSMFSECVGVGNVPVIAYRTAGPQANIAAARRLCDELQRDLAPHGDYAGYIV